VLVVSGLVYLLKMLNGLEKHIFFDSQFGLIGTWNTAMRMGEATFLSAFLLVGIFVIHFIIYFVPQQGNCIRLF